LSAQLYHSHQAKKNRKQEGTTGGEREKENRTSKSRLTARNEGATTLVGSLKTNVPGYCGNERKTGYQARTQKEGHFAANGGGVRASRRGNVNREGEKECKVAIQGSKGNRGPRIEQDRGGCVAWFTLAPRWRGDTGGTYNPGGPARRGGSR